MQTNTDQSKPPNVPLWACYVLWKTFLLGAWEANQRKYSLERDKVMLIGHRPGSWVLINFFFYLLFSGERFGVWLALFPTVYLSAGTATALILIGGETMKLFFQIVCGPLCSSNPLSTVEWYLVFTSLCIVLSQLPNLNSIAGLSLIGAITAITYSTMAWVLSVSQKRPPSISYQPLRSSSSVASLFSALNALGIIAFAFRGHNLALEIQVRSAYSARSINYLTSELYFSVHWHCSRMSSRVVEIFLELCFLLWLQLIPAMKFPGNDAVNFQASCTRAHVERGQGRILFNSNVLIPYCYWRFLGLRQHGMLWLPLSDAWKLYF